MNDEDLLYEFIGESKSVFVNKACLVSYQLLPFLVSCPKVNFKNIKNNSNHDWIA